MIKTLLFCAAVALASPAYSAEEWVIDRNTGRLRAYCGFTISMNLVGDREDLFILRDPEGRFMQRSQILEYLKGVAEDEAMRRREFSRAYSRPMKP